MATQAQEYLALMAQINQTPDPKTLAGLKALDVTSPAPNTSPTTAALPWETGFKATTPAPKAPPVAPKVDPLAAARRQAEQDHSDAVNELAKAGVQLDPNGVCSGPEACYRALSHFRESTSKALAELLQAAYRPATVTEAPEGAVVTKAEHPEASHCGALALTWWKHQRGVSLHVSIRYGADDRDVLRLLPDKLTGLLHVLAQPGGPETLAATQAFLKPPKG